MTCFSELPDGECSVDGLACEMHDNTIAILPNVPTIEECRLLCQDQDNCNYISHFGPGSYPFVETCMLFSACDTLTAMEYSDCSTENIACWTLCSEPLEGQLGENLVQFIPDIVDEFVCRDACRNHSSCHLYTHYKTSSQFFPGACFLLSGLQAPLKEGDHCNTGAGDCKDRHACFLLPDNPSPGENVSSGLLVTDTSPYNFVNILGLGSNCSLSIVAIGGGGSTTEGGFSGGGGGSGYVEVGELKVSGIFDLRTSVGEGGRSSVVWGPEGGNRDREVIVEARSGKDGQSGSGGDGYSGGGGSGEDNGGAGGSNGGNGDEGSGSWMGSGGFGSGLELSNIVLPGFQLR